MLDHGMDMQDAIDMPRLVPASGLKPKIEVEQTVPAATIAELQARRFEIVPNEDPAGGAQVIRIDWETARSLVRFNPARTGSRSASDTGKSSCPLIGSGLCLSCRRSAGGSEADDDSQGLADGPSTRATHSPIARPS